MTNKQIIVLLILVIYMAVNMIVGLKASKLPAKNQKTGSFLQNYFVGGRSMGGLVLAMTLVATYTSASSFFRRSGTRRHMGSYAVMGSCNPDWNSISYFGRNR